ncbi:MAG: EfeM/EfeO family lipoprotein [Geodermatophilaceae bacterium]|nr:EfeM/EfeO family lipoprotein [Geodermatophilaceae bacterium]
MPRRFVTTLLAAVVIAAVTSCGGDDGDDVRTEGSTSQSGSGNGSGSGSGSGSGLSEEDNTGTSDDPDILAGVAAYREYVLGEVTALQADTTAFTDAVRGGDLATAQGLYAPSRVSWERIEPIAGLIEDIDVAVDARVDDFGDETNPEFTGWHKLEWFLFERQTTGGRAAEYADQLDADIADLAAQIPQLEIAPSAVAIGAQELVEEVSRGKITGEEDRYSHTDLWDFAANIEGAQAVIDSLEVALEKFDADLLAEVRAGIDEVFAGLEPYTLPDGGYVSYLELTEDDKAVLQASLAELSENLAEVPAALELS